LQLCGHCGMIAAVAVSYQHQQNHTCASTMEVQEEYPHGPPPENELQETAVY
jgi:hypothetical protein